MALKIQYKPFRIVRNESHDETLSPRRRLACFGALSVVIVGLAGLTVFMILRANERDLQQQAPWATENDETEMVQASPSQRKRSASDQFRGFQSRAEQINRFNQQNSPFAPPMGRGRGPGASPGGFPSQSPMNQPGQPRRRAPGPGSPTWPGPR